MPPTVSDKGLFYLKSWIFSPRYPRRRFRLPETKGRKAKTMKYRIDTIRLLAVLLLLSACPAPVPAEPAHQDRSRAEITAPVPADWIDNPTGGVVFDPVED